MEDSELESLAIKEIIEEIELKHRQEKEARKPPYLQNRPNKRFLGRTINSVLQHNKRQYAREKLNSSKKLKDLDKRRSTTSEHKKPSSRSNETKSPKEKEVSPDMYYQEEEPALMYTEMPMDFTAMYFLNHMNKLLHNNGKKSIKKEKKKDRNDVLTIDLTKKKKQTKEKKKSRKKKVKAKKRKNKKKRKKRKNSSSSSSSLSSSSCSLSDLCDTSSRSSSSDSLCNTKQESKTLMIDLT